MPEIQTQLTGVFSLWKQPRGGGNELLLLYLTLDLVFVEREVRSAHVGGAWARDKSMMLA